MNGFMSGHRDHFAEFLLAPGSEHRALMSTRPCIQNAAVNPRHHADHGAMQDLEVNC